MLRLIGPGRGSRVRKKVNADLKEKEKASFIRETERERERERERKRERERERERERKRETSLPGSVVSGSDWLGKVEAQRVTKRRSRKRIAT